MKLYLGNLSYDTTEEDLKSTLQEFGRVESVTIINDKFSGRSKGFGFAEMASRDEAHSAIEGLNGKEFKGRTLKVNEARPKLENRSSRGGYGGPNRGGGRGSDRGGQGRGRREY